MDIKIQSIHFDATEKLEDFIEKKVSKLEQFHDGILQVDVVLKVVKPETVKNKNASVRLKIKSGECFADKTCDTFEEAIDNVVVALEKQLVKMKEKSRSKKPLSAFKEPEDNEDIEDIDDNEEDTPENN